MKYFAAVCLLALLIASCFAASMTPDSHETKTSVLLNKLQDPAKLEEMSDAKRAGRHYGGWGGYGGYGGGWGGYGGGYGGWGR